MRPRWRGRVLEALFFVLLMVPAYALTAYVLLPASWHHYASRWMPRTAPTTATAEDIPADPVNVELVGTRAAVIEAMREAGWTLADSIGMRSGFRDAHSVLFDRPYPAAPVSTHFLFGRKQDLAFERSAGRSPRQRHHVRLWSTELEGQPRGTVWIGAATFDRAMGVSLYTGEPMHHIDPDVDRERDQLLSDLARAGGVERIEQIRGDQRSGLNGGGDGYRTDGRLLVGVLSARIERRPD